MSANRLRAAYLCTQDLRDKKRRRHKPAPFRFIYAEEGAYVSAPTFGRHLSKRTS